MEHHSNKTSIFFVRSYGDLIVACYALQKTSHPWPAELVLSRHLQPLYAALPEGILPPQFRLRFVNLRIQHNLLAFFTNKFFFTASCARELWQLRRAMQGNDAVYVEQYRKRALLQVLMGRQLRAIHEGGNIYDSYTRFFNTAPAEQPGMAVAKKPLQLLLVPDSRKKDKTLPAALVQRIQNMHLPLGAAVTTAFFRRQPGSPLSRTVVYHDFAQLVALVKQADMVVSPDSFAAHLSQLLGKPHWIFYNRRVNNEWLTPFAKAHHSYGLFANFEALPHFLNHAYENIPGGIPS
jgi:hypothetical protein